MWWHNRKRFYFLQLDAGCSAEVPRNCHIKRRRVYVQRVSSQLEVWPQELTKASGLLYNQQRWAEKKKTRKTVTRRHVALGSCATLLKVAKRGETKMIRCLQAVLYHSRSSRERSRKAERFQRILVCASQSSPILSHFYSTVHFGFYKVKRQIIFLDFSIVVFFCYTTLQTNMVV